MQKVRLAVCIGDTEYANRFTNCLLGYYRNQFELHIFTEPAQVLEETNGNFDALLCSDCPEELAALADNRAEPVLYLWDEEEPRDAFLGEMEGGICFVDKYQEVNRIVDEILRNIGDEIREVQRFGNIPPKCRIIAVYSLSENEYQLPFTVTMGSILSEQQRVLILDIQENSGFTQLAQREGSMGLEEILVMAEGGKYAKNRLLSCIGHLDRTDFIYPAENTECLCEADSATYLKLLQMLTQELDYGVILVNLGARFVGFFEVLNRCQEIYLMQKKGGLCQWREYEFMEELQNKGYSGLADKMTRVEVPVLSSPVTSCERLVEQWKWNEFGDLIRRMIPGAVSIG